MTIIRIDFLKDTERRYQGPVRFHFLVYAVAATIAAVLLLSLAYTVVRFVTLGREIALRRQSWTAAEPRHRSLKESETARHTVNGYLAELEGWRTTRIAWGRQLVNIQRLTPPAAHLSRMDLRDDWTALPPAQPGQPFPDPSLQLRVVLNGRVYGDKGEEVASQFVNLLRQPSRGTNIYRHVEMVSTRREAFHQEPALAFDIEANGDPRLLK